MIRAWRTVVVGLTSAVAATTRGKAHAITLRAAREGGWHGVRWTDVRVVRWPEHDGWAEVASFDGPLDPLLLPPAGELPLLLLTQGGR